MFVKYTLAACTRKELFVFTILLVFASTCASAQGWQKLFGGKNDDFASDMAPAPDQGFIFVGTTMSFDVQSTEVLVVRCDAQGNVVWQKTLGSYGVDTGIKIAPSMDGAYLIGGMTTNGGSQQNNISITKISGDGDVLWERIFGKTNYSTISAMSATADGGYVLTTNYENEILIYKLDSEGHTEWTERCCGFSRDVAYDIRQTRDGGYVLAGASDYFAARSSDFLVAKLDAQGALVWSRHMGDAYSDRANAVREVLDGGYIAAGYYSGFHSEYSQAALVRLNADGELLWERLYGGNGSDSFEAIVQSRDLGFFAAGLTSSYGEGLSDIYAVKVTHDGEPEWETTFGGKHNDYADQVIALPDDSFITIGESKSFSALEWDVFIIKTDANGFSGTPPD